MSRKAKTSVLHLRVSPEWVALIDEWRAGHPHFLARTAAIQILIERGFTSAKPVNTPPDVMYHLPADLAARISAYHKKHRSFRSKDKLVAHLLDRALDLIEEHLSTAATEKVDWMRR